MPVKHIDEMGELYESRIVGKQDQLDNDTKTFKDSGPEHAEGFEPAEADPKNKRKDSALEEDKFSNNVEEKSEKSVKKEQNEINNSTMRENSNKSSFDKLFEDVMGDDLPMDLDMGGDVEDHGGDDLGDDLGGDDTVTLELDRDMAEKLHASLGDLLGDVDGDDDSDVDDIEDMGDVEEEEMHPEAATELEHGPSDAVSKLAAKNNKVGNNSVHPSGGHADGSAGGEEDGGKPKPAHDGVATQTNKNNKVVSNHKGGNQDAFKA